MDMLMHRNYSLLWKKISQTNPKLRYSSLKCIVKRVIYVKYQNIFNFHPPLFSDIRLIGGNIAFKPVPNLDFFISIIKMFLSRKQLYIVWKFISDTMQHFKIWSKPYEITQQSK